MVYVLFFHFMLMSTLILLWALAECYHYFPDIGSQCNDFRWLTNKSLSTIFVNHFPSISFEVCFWKGCRRSRWPKLMDHNVTTNVPGRAVAWNARLQLNLMA